MTAELITKRREAKRLKNMLKKEQDSIWESVRGLWKNHKVNPVTYQRKLREAADRRLS